MFVSQRYYSLARELCSGSIRFDCTAVIRLRPLRKAGGGKGLCVFVPSIGCARSGLGAATLAPCAHMSITNRDRRDARYQYCARYTIALCTVHRQCRVLTFFAVACFCDNM